MPSQPCPACGIELPVEPGLIVWCHECGWNLSQPERGPAGALERTAGAIARRLDDRLHEKLAGRDDLSVRLTAARLGGYAIAIAVHALVLGLAVTGIWLLVSDVTLFPKIGGALLLGLVFLMRPRLGARPSEGVLQREEAPALYGLADEIAAELGAPAPQTIVVTPAFNASWSTVGLRRERVLTLGLPLLAVLDEDEQVALIAHEIAHSRNGDSFRGLVVGSAVESLWQLYVTLAPDSAQLESDVGALEVVIRPIMWLMAQPFRLLLLLELQLLLRDSQRAEYMADALAAQVAGTSAVVRLHEKLLLDSSATMAIHRYAMGRQAFEGDVFDAMRDAIESVPERELERRRRLARLETTRLRATHPATGRRILLLERRGAAPASLAPDSARRNAVEADLRAVRSRLSKRLVEEYRSSLHG